eukprot:UN32649
MKPLETYTTLKRQIIQFENDLKEVQNDVKNDKVLASVIGQLKNMKDELEELRKRNSYRQYFEKDNNNFSIQGRKKFSSTS